MTYITLFGLQLFMAAHSSSAIIKSVAGHPVCVFNPYSFGVLNIWKDFFYEEENSALKVVCFLFST